jgi:hypothetical protein
MALRKIILLTCLLGKFLLLRVKTDVWESALFGVSDIPSQNQQKDECFSLNRGLVMIG